MKKMMSLLGCLLAVSLLSAQCKIAFDEIDEFDSLRTVAAAPVSIGFLIPSLYETESGPKLIEEGKVLFSFSQNDSINSFFLTLVIPEYSFQSIEADFNVLIRLSEGDILTLYNVPDRGEFDKTTNMRVYQHTCVVPLDLFYRLTFSTIEAMRINYKKQKRTLKISEEQANAIRQAVQCVGKQIGLYPVKP